MRKLRLTFGILTLVVLAALVPVARANSNAQGWCESGAQIVVTSGLNSTTQVQASYPTCNVTVFVHGGGLATIYSDNSNTPLANPFAAQTSGRWIFYAANGRYDIQMSGGGLPSPVTYSDVVLSDPQVTNVATLPNTTLPFSATPAFNATANISYSMPLTGNVTSSTITGSPANGNLLSLTLTEDGVGGRSFAFPGNFVFTPTFGFVTTPNAINELTFKFDGTNWHLISNSGSGGGGGVPASPNFQAQVYNSGAFASTPCFNVTVPTSASAIGQMDCDVRPKGPNPGIDIRAYNARAISPGAAPTATATYTSGSPNMTLGAASTFQNGDWVVVYGAGTSTVNTPAAPTVSPINAASQTMTLFDVAGTGGGTQYCYQILARTFLGGTSVSPETCTATGSTTLGLQTATITNISLSNNIATYTTSAAHRLTTGSLVRIVGTTTKEVGGTIFDGWTIVQSVPDNTHFTTWLSADTRAGAITTGTGGTVNYWSGNHILAAATTNNYQFYVYGRVTGGTKTLIGVMQPQPFGSTCATVFPFGDSITCLAFDDFGTGVLTSAPGVPSYIPGVVPGAGTTNDMLLTQIVSGAGTTSITVANNANANSSGTILFDDAQALLAARNAAGSPGSEGTIIIPSSGSAALSFVFNAPIQIANVGPRPNIQQSGDIVLNEPIVFSTFTKWTGIPGGTQSTAGFSQQVQPQISFNKASPGMYVVNQTSMYLSNVLMTEIMSNSGVMYLQDSAGIPASTFKDVTFIENTGALSHSNIAAVFRGGGADLQFVNVTAASSQNGTFTGYADSTPIMNFNQMGNEKFDYLYLSGGGISILTSNQGASQYIKVNELYCQACYMPFISIGGSLAQPVFGHISNVISDTTFDGPVLSNFVGAPLFMSGDAGFPGSESTGGGFSGPAIGHTINNTETSGFPISNVKTSGGNGTYIHGSRFSVNDGVFGRIQLGVDFLNRSLQLGQGFSIFTGQSAYTAPTCVVSAGGSLTVGTWFITYSPVFNWSGSDGTMSQYCTATTTGGNQTITATVPTPIAGSIATDWSAGLTTLSALNFCQGQGNVTTLALSSNGQCVNSIISSASGGPAGIKNGTVGGQTIQAGLTAMTSSAVIQEPAVFPDNTTGGIIPVTGYRNTAYDDFNRASLNTNGPCAGGSCWTAINPPNTLPTISSNQLTGGTAATWTGAFWNADTFYADQYASASIVVIGAGGGGSVVPMLRYNASLNKAYQCGGNIALVNFTNNTFSNVATGLTINNGDTVWCEAHGTTITSYNLTTGASISGTDSTIATGSPGITIFNANANFADNWAAGNYHPIVQADAALNWKSPQHFTAVTVGAGAPIAGALASGLLTDSNNVVTLGVPCTNGELALSAGWQSTGAATVTAVAGTGQTCSWTITTGTTTAANPTVTDTLTNVLPTATTVCELNIHGGTHTAVLGEYFTQTTLSATAPIFTATFTPTAGGTTYFVTRRCGP
jgi:hypothetical protein